ncbi:MAG: DUF6270 domain-containing protein [Marmoricola sp.]|jgi:hypothetical protein
MPPAAMPSALPREPLGAPDGLRETVAVAGSCLTRDNFNSRFNVGHADHYDVRANSNQSSMIALMSPPIDATFEPLRPMNDYDKWNIRTDLSREFLSRLAEEQPDLLLLDFQGDVRFGVAQLPDGRYFTDHSWKTQHTDFYARLKESGALTLHKHEVDPEGYFALWTEALHRFASYVEKTCPTTKVIVHRGHHASRIVVRGRARSIPLHRHKKFRGIDLAAADAWWARLDDYAVDTFGWDQIDLRDLGAPTYNEHPWGAYFGHYTPDYYHRFMAELTKISLRRRLDPETMRRVELVEAAAAEPWQRRHAEEQAVARAHRRRLRVARRRVAELEGLGFVGSLRFVVGTAFRRRRTGSQSTVVANAKMSSADGTK